MPTRRTVCDTGRSLCWVSYGFFLKEGWPLQTAMSRATPAKMAHTSKGIREVAQINIATTTEPLNAEGAHSASEASRKITCVSAWT